MIRAAMYAVLICGVMTIGLITFDLYQSKAEPFASNKQALSEEAEQPAQNAIDPEEPTLSIKIKTVQEPEDELDISSVKNNQPKNPAISQAQQETPQITVTILIRGLRNQQGQIIAQIFDKEQAFDNNQYDQAFRTIITPAKNFTGELHFKNLPKAEYAIVLFHDENSNQQFDQFNALIEGYAFSNNTGKSAPAKFQQAAFIADKDQKLIINLIYH